MKRQRTLRIAGGSAALALAVLTLAAVSEQAADLRNRGIAQLENERPTEASEIFTELTRLAPDEPLGWANLAISHLRLQQTAEAHTAIGRALAVAPNDPRLLAILGDIQQWEGKQPEALVTFRRAATAAPDDVEIQYALYRLASALGDETAGADLDLALGNLARLRPDNLVVMLQLGQRAVQQGDRTGATNAYLRIRELLWQAPPIAERALGMLLDALESDETGAARTPAQRMTNVLVVTPAYQQGLRELATGIQGIPITRFDDEPASTSFGQPVEVAFQASPISDEAVAGRGLALGDFDGDQQTDLAWLDGGAGLRVKLSSSHSIAAIGAAPAGSRNLLAADLDNDGLLDLLALGGERVELWQGQPGGAFGVATEAFGLAATGATAAAAIDFDIEGDLDLVLAGGSTATRLFRNNLAGALEKITASSLPALPDATVRDAVASDLDRDGDVDLILAHQGGLAWFDNLRQGEFALRSDDLGPAAGAEGVAIASADLDNDGFPDLVVAGEGVRLFHNLGGTFESWDLGEQLRTGASFSDVAAFDADNDGRLDLVLAGEAGVVVAAQRPDGFKFFPVRGDLSAATAVAASDLDGDGDLDLAVGTAGGLFELDNQGGNTNRWLSLRLRGLTKGNSKNNILGLGSTIEIRDGRAYQFRETTSDVTHFGLGSLTSAPVVRVVWTNGVPQNRLDLATNQTLVEEQLLKGSCPFVYAWNGETVEFVTDLLWGAPIGLPLAPGAWMPADPSELVHIPQARPVGARYDLRITEELWEAAFFDHVRLWVVDYPDAVEVASSLRILPGSETPEQVLGTRNLRAPVGAWDGAGREVTNRIAQRDEIYADGWTASPYQGVASRPWTFTFDLGEAPAAPVRLHLDGWIFPADASLNLAVAQRSDLGNPPPRLEVETAEGWQVLMEAMGFPAGKTKTMVIDTPALPAGTRRLRIVTGQWLSWDRIAWSTQPSDDEPRIVAQLDPAVAELRSRGFSRIERRAPNAPHHFDYADTSTASPWLPFPGNYTRFGDVRELLTEVDDRTVVMAAGDEMHLIFDASSLSPPAAGWSRTVFLESHGWDKDGDRNTGEGLEVFPLPFHAMTAYPYGPNDRYPSHLERYVSEWLTRRVDSDLRLGEPANERQASSTNQTAPPRPR